MATLKEILELGREQLQTISEAYSLEAELLLAHTLDKPRSHLFTWPEETVSNETLQEYAALIHARREGRPIAYLTGTREFWSMDLKVTPATLIPRPDTELLVQQALERLPEEAAWQVLDLGTGSGAIALAIARERQHTQVTATDIMPSALEVARENAEDIGVNIQFIESDWFSALAPQRYDMIVSNPPYIPRGDQHLQHGDVRFEPLLALAAGPDGLDAYRAILPMAKQFLNDSGWLLLEHGFDQAEAVRNLMEEQKFQGITTYQDLSGHDRVTVAQNISNS